MECVGDWWGVLQLLILLVTGSPLRLAQVTLLGFLTGGDKRNDQRKLNSIVPLRAPYKAIPRLR